MKRIISVFTVVLTFCLSSYAADGVIDIASEHSVKDTVSRFEQIAKEKGITIFKVVDHTAGAKKVGLDLHNAQVIIFGNPKVGTPLMQCAASIAIDLPQKALVWQDEQNQTYISYNDPSYLKARHKVEGCDKVFAKISKVLAALSTAAAKK